MGTLTDRRYAKDVSVLDISGVSLLARYTDASIEFTTDEVDMTALQDTWRQREIDFLDWSMNCTALEPDTAKAEFVDMFIDQNPVVVSCDIAGMSFIGTGVITGLTLDGGSPQTQAATIAQCGGSPST